jgi:hypothetical protein
MQGRCALMSAAVLHRRVSLMMLQRACARCVRKLARAAVRRLHVALHIPHHSLHIQHTAGWLLSTDRRQTSNSSWANDAQCLAGFATPAAPDQQSA